MNTLLALIDTVSILFIGDVMQHRNQLQSALEYGQDTLYASSYDYSSYFEHTSTYILEADFTVANMEFALAGAPYTGYPSFSAPETLAEETAKAGVDLFLCANNHICDKGRKGLAATIRNYEAIGIPTTGLYADSASQSDNYPYIVDIKGVRVAFINFTYGTNGIKVPTPYRVNMMDRKAVSAAIAKAKNMDADIIIALPHWGTEYVTAADAGQKQWKEFLIREGVDAIVGTHPHIVQPVEADVKEDGTTVATAYSLGNFISNMSLSGTELGLMFRLDIAVGEDGEAGIAGHEAIPVWCSRAGRYSGKFTVLPVKEFLDKRDEFILKSDYDKMKRTYERLKHLFEDGSEE